MVSRGHEGVLGERRGGLDRTFIICRVRRGVPPQSTKGGNGMKRKLLALVFVLAFAITSFAALGATGVSAVPIPGEAACDGANGGVDNAFAAATAPGRAGDNVPAGQVDFVITTVVDSNPEVPATLCP